MKTSRELANLKYEDEVWTPLVLRPDAMSTSRWDDIARLLRAEKGRVLEIGCGSGQLLLGIANQFDELVGLDVSDVRINRAEDVLRDRYPEHRSKLQFLRKDVNEKLPFEDRVFDVVIACVVIEVVPDVFGLMDELARVVRPGGCLVVSVANVCCVKHVLDMLRGRIPVTWSPTRDMAQWRTRGWDDGCLRYFSKSALAGLLRECGFEPEAWSGSGKFARFRRWSSRLCGDLTVRARRTDRRLPASPSAKNS